MGKYVNAPSGVEQAKDLTSFVVMVKNFIRAVSFASLLAAIHFQSLVSLIGNCFVIRKAPCTSQLSAVACDWLCLF